MLGLGLGMGVGNKVPLLPVSEFTSIDAIQPGMVVLDSDGVVKECESVNKYQYAVQTLCSSASLSREICFVKHRADYFEYSVYVPIDSTGTNFARLYFGNRFNAGNAGFPRLIFAAYASLTGEIGAADFTQANVVGTITSPINALDVIVGTGNVEYAVKTRKATGETEDFVTGTHGKESLNSFELWIDDVPFAYSSATVQGKIVCKKLKFQAVCLVGYPSDAETKWMEIVYTGIIESGKYTITVNTRVLLDSDVNVEYAGLLMSPGSLSTQKYAGGIDRFELGAESYTLNSFNGVVVVRPGFDNAACYNQSVICASSFPDYLTIENPYLTNKETAGRYTSRTDKINKIYWLSSNEGWKRFLTGYSASYHTAFEFRHGDATQFDWGINNNQNILLPA